VLGLTLAQRLAALGAQVTVYDAAERVGGLAAPWELGGVTWDRHYHVTLLSDERTRRMYADIGIPDDQLRWVETRTGYYGSDETLRSATTPLELLQLPGLSLLDKARLGATVLYGSRIADGTRMETLTVERWLRRWSGDGAFEAFWRPLLRAKLGDTYPDASAAFIWATIRRLYAARRMGLVERFGYVSGGYATVCTAFDAALETAGVEVRTSTPVRSISRCSEGSDALSLQPADGDAQLFDKVFVTTAAPVAAKLCTDLLPGERRRLEAVQYVGIVCASLLLRRPLADYYLTYITDPATPFTAVVEMTSLVDRAELDGHALVYLPKYTTADDALFGADDDSVLAQMLPYLRSMYPAFSDDDIVAARVSRVPQVFAVPSLRYSEAMPSFGTSIPGLYLAGSAQLPFATLNVNDTLSLVDDVLADARLTDEEHRR
jgi:protoporphyrinogen oxidase